MGNRRRAREFTLKILYQHDITAANISKSLEDFFNVKKCNDKVRDFTIELVTGTVENIKEIDKLINKSSENWPLKRMSVIDRNIIRFSAFEILKKPDIHHTISINEAIELAKKYGNEDSAKFVNGILDKLKDICKNNS